MTRTTVVIPTYNGIKYIENCLKSLAVQDVDVDVIVVDNASCDGTCDLIKEKFPKVKLIELDSNTGFCHAMNVGMSNASTEYIFALNDDTELLSDTVSKLERVMDQHKEIFSVQAKMLKLTDRHVIDSAGDYYCALGWGYSKGKDKNASYYETGVHNIFSACAGACMYRKSVLNEIGMFDENHFAYLEDVDLGYRAMIYGYKNVVSYDAVVYHAGSASSGSRYNEFKTRHSSRNSIYVIYKNMPLLQIIFNLLFLMIGYLIKIVFFYRKGLGKTYVKGILEGVGNCVKAGSPVKKVPFSSKRIVNYLKIQILLWVNILRRFG